MGTWDVGPFNNDTAADWIPADIPPLALRALDRIVGDDSEWRDLWEDAGSYADAVEALQTIRTTLERATA